MAFASRADAAPAAGFTLLEMLVVIAVLGVLAGIVGLAWRDWAPAAPPAGPAADIAAAHRRALATGLRVELSLTAGGRTRRVTALPDGRLLGAEALGFGPLDARPPRPVANAAAAARVP